MVDSRCTLTSYDHCQKIALLVYAVCSRTMDSLVCRLATLSQRRAHLAVRHRLVIGGIGVAPVRHHPSPLIGKSLLEGPFARDMGSL